MQPTLDVEGLQYSDFNIVCLNMAKQSTRLENVLISAMICMQLGAIYPALPFDEQIWQLSARHIGKALGLAPAEDNNFVTSEFHAVCRRTAGKMPSNILSALQKAIGEALLCMQKSHRLEAHRKNRRRYYSACNGF
jgi:hypothetical protein